MRNVDINNPHIQARLDGFAEKLNALKPPPIDHRDTSIDKHMGVSTEYLHRIMEEGHRGSPKSIKGADLLRQWRDTPEWREIFEDVSFNFPRELGLDWNDGMNALCFFYPEDGFVGWHTNEDAPGHTLLFTWSETGDGFYRFKDKDSGEIKTLPDKPGWVCRTGYYGDGVFGRIQWHCALTNEPRWSIAFCIRRAEMTEMIVKDIECSDGRSII